MWSKEFSLDDLQNEPVVWCPTEDDAVAFLDLLQEMGWRWSGGEPMTITHFGNYDETVYYPYRGKTLKYSGKHTAISHRSDDRFRVFNSRPQVEVADLI